MMYPYTKWAPDIPAIRNQDLTLAKNVIPTAEGFRAFPDLTIFSNALDAYARGAFICKDKDGNAYSFAGNASKLYSLSSATYSDISKGGGYTTGSNERWEFEKWAEQIVAVNFSDAPQVITLGGANFADLGGAPPKARHVAVVDEFMFLANVFDSIDGNVPSRLWWSAAGDVTDWTPSAITQCGYTTLYGKGGPIQRILSGQYLTVFQQRSIQRFSRVSPPQIWERDEIEPGRGALCPGGVVQLGRFVFYIGQDGFYFFNGEYSEPIGADVDKTFIGELDANNLDRVSAEIDPQNKLVVWAVPVAGNVSGRPNKLYIYHWPTQRWSFVEKEVELLTTHQQDGYTLEQLDAFGDIDSIAASLDSTQWMGGATSFSAFDTSSRLANWTGTPLPATFETGELNHERKAKIDYIRNLADGGTSTFNIGTRNAQTDAVSWSANTIKSRTGKHNIRGTTARYHRFRQNISGGFTLIPGLDIAVKARGK